MKPGDRQTLNEIIRQYNNQLEEVEPLQNQVIDMRKQLSYLEGKLDIMQKELVRLDTLRNAIAGVPGMTSYERFEIIYKQ